MPSTIDDDTWCYGAFPLRTGVTVISVLVFICGFSQTLGWGLIAVGIWQDAEFWPEETLIPQVVASFGLMVAAAILFSALRYYKSRTYEASPMRIRVFVIYSVMFATIHMALALANFVRALFFWEEPNVEQVITDVFLITVYYEILVGALIVHRYLQKVLKPIDYPVNENGSSVLAPEK